MANAQQLLVSSAASLSLTITLVTLNYLVKSTEETFSATIPLCTSAFVVPVSFLMLKKNSPSFSKELVLLCSFYALVDFLILWFVLTMLLKNSAVIIFSATCFTMNIINTLYGNNNNLVCISIFIGTTAFLYTLYMERVEIKGNTPDSGDLDELIANNRILNSFTLMYLIPGRIYVFSEYNKDEYKNTHVILSTVVFLICIFMALAFPRSFYNELQLIKENTKTFLVCTAPLLMFYALVVCMLDYIKYETFVVTYFIWVSAGSLLYVTDLLGGIFYKNALEDALLVFYMPILLFFFSVVITSKDLRDYSGAITERFRILGFNPINTNT